MKTMSFLFFILVTVQNILIIPSTATVYYVKPSTATNCPDQPCETLHYYFENVGTTINKQDNVTMIFLTGTHAVGNISSAVVIRVPILNMTGESQEVILNGANSLGVTWLTFSSSSESDVHLQSLTMIQLAIIVQNLITQQVSRFEMSSVKLYWSHLTISSTAISLVFDTCEFHDDLVMIGTLSDRSTVTMKNIMSISSPIHVQKCTVVVSGVSYFSATNQKSAISTYLCNITLSGRVTFADNSGIRGGAMALYSSNLNIAPGTVAKFINNTVLETGGAIYIDPSLLPSQLLMIMEHDSFPEVETIDIHPQSFYQLLDCSDGANYTLSFVNNFADNGGDDIYGASLKFHQAGSKCNLTVTGVSSGISSVSSNPTRVCICDGNGEPQCENNSYIYKNYRVHPGETFKIPVVVVGGDFGATIGPIFADFVGSFNQSLAHPSFTSNSQYIQAITTITRDQCSELNFSMYHYNRGKIVMYLTTVYIGVMEERSQCLPRDETCFHSTPVFLNITLLPCPPGLMLSGEHPICDCRTVLSNNGIKCNIINGKGVFTWSGNQWVNVSEDSIVFGEYCPFDYCKQNNSQIDVLNNSSGQCAFNRVGRLCGGCKENYSLAIGSSHCIRCLNNDNNLALLVFFVAAGFLLVFFISALNLTVTQGTINGLVFYANVVWMYQCIFFPEEQKIYGVLTFLRTFIAWINLDFGIETCFVSGLTAFWKTWLQFVFPFYIWAIAGMIIVAAKYSTRLTNLLGNRAVPVLDTLILLSHMKLLRIVAATLEFSKFTVYPSGSTTVVWSVDGNLSYFGFPHFLLFLAGLATLLFLWLPYTLLLFLMQWLRRLPNFKFLKWIMRIHPAYDAYFAPLKLKHQYWFGVLLLTRGLLLLTFASTFNIPQNINLILLLIVAVALLFYIAQTHPYKNTPILLLQSSFLANLAIVSGFVIFAQTHQNKTALKAGAVGLSTGIAFLQFCVIIIHAIIVPRCSCSKRSSTLYFPSEHSNKYRNIVEPVADITDSTGYRDSILDDNDAVIDDDTQPLLTSDSNAKYKQIE